jgi:hypothetical protein
VGELLGPPTELINSIEATNVSYPSFLCAKLRVTVPPGERVPAKVWVIT